MPPIPEPLREQRYAHLALALLEGKKYEPAVREAGWSPMTARKKAYQIVRRKELYQVLRKVLKGWPHDPLWDQLVALEKTSLGLLNMMLSLLRQARLRKLLKEWDS